MGLILPITIYLLILAYIIARHLIALFNSEKPIIKSLSLTATGLFLAYQLWGLIPFVKNGNGKSFTVGWFALIYFLAVSFTVFAIVSWSLRLIEKKL
jgi:hypothetical protein